MANNQRRISKLGKVMDSLANGGNGDPLSLGLIGMRGWYIAVDASRGLSPADAVSTIDSTWKMPLARLALRNSSGIIPSEMLPSYVDDIIFGQFFDDANGQYFVSVPDSASSATEPSSVPTVHYKTSTFPGSSVTLDGTTYSSFTVSLAVSGKIYCDIYTYQQNSRTVQYRFAGSDFVPIIESYTYAPGNGVAIDPVSGGVYPIRARVASPIAFDPSGYIWHEYSGVASSDTGVSAGLSAAATPGFGDTVNLVGMHVTRYGHVSSLADYVLTIPSTVAGSNSNGLLTSNHYALLSSMSHVTTSTDWLNGRMFTSGATSYTVPYLLPAASYSVGAAGMLYDSEHGSLHIGENSSTASSYSMLLGSYVGDHALMRSYVLPDSGTTYLDLMITDTNASASYGNAIRFLENGHAGFNRQLLHSMMLNNYYCALYVGGPENAGQSVFGLYNSSNCYVGFTPNWGMSSGNSYFIELPAAAASGNDMAMVSGTTRGTNVGNILNTRWSTAVLAGDVQTLTADQKSVARTNIGAAASALVHGSITPADTPVPLTLYEQNNVRIYIQANSSSAVAIYLTATPAVNSGFRATRSSTVTFYSNAANSNAVLIGAFSANDLQDSGGYGHLVIDWSGHIASFDIMLLVAGSTCAVSSLVNYI